MRRGSTRRIPRPPAATSERVPRGGSSRLSSAGCRRQSREGRVPLVVAAVDDDAAVFRLVSSHPKLLTLTGLGSPAGVSLARLHDAAADLVVEHGCEDHEARRTRFADLARTGHTAREVCELRAAVADGRIETLFVGDHTALPTATMLQIVAGTLRSGGTVLASAPSDEIEPIVAATLRN